MAAHELPTASRTSCIAQRGEELLRVSFGGLGGVIFDGLHSFVTRMFSSFISLVSCLGWLRPGEGFILAHAYLGTLTFSYYTALSRATTSPSMRSMVSPAGALDGHSHAAPLKKSPVPRIHFMCLEVWSCSEETLLAQVDDHAMLHPHPQHQILAVHFESHCKRSLLESEGGRHKTSPGCTYTLRRVRDSYILTVVSHAACMSLK